MATIVHFEIPADNIERTNKFYGNLFGWKMEKMAGPMEYWTFRTTNDKGEQIIGGGIMKRQMPDQGIINYIGVDSVDKYSKKVQELGGKVKVQKTEVPGFGWFAVCTDTENNTFALWEANPQAQHH
ncbi:MAG TPA: VOC family protein [Nitrososphaera sp.]|jgi:predicted enzyme related to lactoylglutathione lyase|nr:VOC family protein [uncultured Nitrososphaera sp.]